MRKGEVRRTQRHHFTIPSDLMGTGMIDAAADITARKTSSAHRLAAVCKAFPPQNCAWICVSTNSGAGGGGRETGEQVTCHCGLRSVRVRF